MVNKVVEVPAELIIWGSDLWSGGYLSNQVERFFFHFSQKVMLDG